MVPEQNELLGLLRTGSAINRTCRNLRFNLPTQAPQFWVNAPSPAQSVAKPYLLQWTPQN